MIYYVYRVIGGKNQMTNIYLSYLRETSEMYQLKGYSQLFKVAFMEEGGKVKFKENMLETIEYVTKESKEDKIKIFALELNTLSAYIEYELINAGYNILKHRIKLNNYEMHTLRNEKGMTFTIVLKVNDVEVEFVDISKISMTKTEDLYNIFGLEEQKVPSFLDKGKEYTAVKRKLLLDLTIISKYLQKNEYGGELTGTGASFKELKKSYKGNFNKDFPRIDDLLYDTLNPAYKGGVILAHDYFLEKKIRAISFDMNSSYIDSMTGVLPKGLPTVGEGQYTGNKLFIQEFRAEFDLKEGRIPFIQNKFFDKIHNHFDLYGEPLLLCSLDLEMFFNNYHVYSIEYITYYEFESIENPFKEFIAKYYNMKLNAKKVGDKITEARAKVRLNSCYGKFASKTTYKNTIPGYTQDEEGIQYRQVENKAKAQYLPLAIFISAYSRYKLIDTINKVTDAEINLIYSDTDSIYIEESEENLKKIEEILDISDYKLGAWKRQEDGYIKTFGNKTYIFQGDETGKVEVVASGLSVDEEFEDFDSIKSGMNIKCLERRKVLGGYATITVYKRLGKPDLEELQNIFRKKKTKQGEQ